MSMLDPHAEGEAYALIPSNKDLRKACVYRLGEHKIHVHRKTRKHSNSEFFVSGSAYCNCGWSSATHISNDVLVAEVRGHV